MPELHVVLGAGPLGRSVTVELVRRGRTVRVISRSGLMAEAPRGAELIGGDLYDPAFVRDNTRGASVVYQCAQPHYNQWPAKFPPLQDSILEGLAGSRTKLVIAENLYMYGDTDGRPLTEDLPYAAHTRKGRVRAAMSESAIAAHQAGKVRVAIGRGSDFYGPWVHDSSYGDRVFYSALSGKTASFAGRLDQPHTVTYIADFGKGLVILGEREDALGQAWHISNDRPSITQGEFARLVFEQLGLPLKASGMGKGMLRLGGIFVPAAREVIEMMYEFEKPFIVDSSRFELTFEVKPTPLPEAIQATLAWYRGHSRK
jgi:nucleoside-diphosphate-sugar epimerase